MHDSARTIFALQREVLFRARRAIFLGISNLGGAPTQREEENEAEKDAQTGASMVRALYEALGAARAREIVSGAFAREQQNYWKPRVPARLSFGARSHAQLTSVAPFAVEEPRLMHAAALFQLAASLLDWIGDEYGGSDEILARLPTAQFSQFVTESDFRRELVAGVHLEARPPIGAFMTLIGATVEMVSRLPLDTGPFSEYLCFAYEAELASFESAASIDVQLSIARRKSMAPTVVIGELARLAADEDNCGIVWTAMNTIAPVFGTIDDIQDLSADLRKGHVNTLSASLSLLDDSDVVHSLTALLATNLIEERSSNVVRNIQNLSELLKDSCTASREVSVFAWLRVIIWRWLS